MTVTDHDKYYWNYEYEVVANYLLPLLQSWGMEFEGKRLLDVGCGDGGGLAALHDAGMVCKGFDIEQRRVDLAMAMCGNRKMELTVGDIYKTPVPFQEERFDFVVLHDVFEHLERKEYVLKVLKSYLTPQGKIMITFPPYYSAFGAHQQLMRTKIVRIPFIHHFPGMVSTIFPMIKGEHKPFIEEIQKLARLKMGMKKFERLLPDAGLRIEHKRGYIISPNHIRFGLKPISAGTISGMPLIGELLTSGVVYLIQGM